MYDERLTIQKTSAKIRFQSLSRAVAKLPPKPSCILKPFHVVRLGHFTAFFYRTPRKGTLLSVLAKVGRLSDDQAMLVCTQVWSAVEEIHSAGLVLRFVPLASILIDNEGVKLDILDFLQGKEESINSTIMMSNYLRGLVPKEDVQIFPPELVLSKRVNLQTTMFSIGMLYYVLLEGKYPQLYKDPKYLALYYETAQNIEFEFSPQVPSEIKRLIMDLTQIDPLKRPKITAMRSLMSSFDKVIGSRKDLMMGQLFDFRFFVGGNIESEMNRCYTRISSALKYDPPEGLKIPKVFLKGPEQGKSKSVLPKDH